MHSLICYWNLSNIYCDFFWQKGTECGICNFCSP